MRHRCLAGVRRSRHEVPPARAPAARPLATFQPHSPPSVGARANIAPVDMSKPQREASGSLALPSVSHDPGSAPRPTRRGSRPLRGPRARRPHKEPTGRNRESLRADHRAGASPRRRRFPDSRAPRRGAPSVGPVPNRARGRRWTRPERANGAAVGAVLRSRSPPVSRCGALRWPTPRGPSVPSPICNFL